MASFAAIIFNKKEKKISLICKSLNVTTCCIKSCCDTEMVHSTFNANNLTICAESEYLDQTARSAKTQLRLRFMTSAVRLISKELFYKRHQSSY